MYELEKFRNNGNKIFKIFALKKITFAPRDEAYKFYGFDSQVWRKQYYSLIFLHDQLETKLLKIVIQGFDFQHAR